MGWVVINQYQTNRNRSMLNLKDEKFTQKLASLPYVQEPSQLLPLPALGFTIQASLPLDIQHFSHFQKTYQLENRLQKERAERIEVQTSFFKLNQEYEKLTKQHKQIKQKYHDGEILFREIQIENDRLFRELENMKKQKERSKSTISLKKKQVPIVKINVPNHKQESQKDSIYRQLKGASEELNFVKRKFEQQKQKAQQIQHYMSKNIEQITLEKEMLKKEIQQAKEENRNLREELNKARYEHSKTVAPNQKMVENELERVKVELQRLETLHKCCDVLMSSRQNEIQTLKSQMRNLSSKTQLSNSSQKSQVNKNLNFSRVITIFQNY